jgi:hypothetical protein
MKSTYDDAVNNINAVTGRDLSPADEEYLRRILTHPCGWSATYRDRMNDKWTDFFRNNYPQLKGLALVWDSLTYEEELVDLPDGLRPIRPTFFLLATPELYYFYDFSDEGYGMTRAGKTLEEVYIGMKEYKYMDWKDDGWDFEDAIGGLLDSKYLPIFYRKEKGLFGRREIDRIVVKGTQEYQLNDAVYLKLRNDELLF